MMIRYLFLLALLFPLSAIAAQQTVTISGDGTCVISSVTDTSCDATGGDTVDISRDGPGLPPQNDDIWIVDSGAVNPVFDIDITGTANSGEVVKLWYCPNATGPPTAPWDFSDCVGSADWLYTETGGTHWMISSHQLREIKRILGNNFFLKNYLTSTNDTLAIELTNELLGIGFETYHLICDPRPSSDMRCNNGGGASLDPVAFRSVVTEVVPAFAPIMQIDGDFTQSNLALAGVQVTYGARLETGEDPVNITLGPGSPIYDYAQSHRFGIINRGTVDLRGDWYTTETGSVTYVNDIDSEVLFQVPEIIPCAVRSVDDVISDCSVAANREFVALRWTDKYEGIGTGGTGEPHIGDLIVAIEANIAAGRKALMSFPDLSLGTANDLPNDFWGSYVIEEAEGSGGTQPYWVKLSIRSGDVDTAAFCFADRQDIQTGVLVGTDVPTPSFDRVQVNSLVLNGVSVCGAALPNREHEFSGRWIRFRNAADTAWECQGYPIGHIIDNVNGDVVVLAGDPDVGDTLRRTYQAGDEYVIDYGWKCGESIAFQRPTYITSATTTTTGVTTTDSIPMNLGSMTLSGIYNQHIGGYQSIGAALFDIEYLTINDQTWENTTGATFRTVVSKLTDIGPGVYVSGGAETRNDHQHYIVLSADSGTINIHDFQFRHAGDDFILPTSVSLPSVRPGTQPELTKAFNVNRGKMGWVSDTTQSQSGGVFDFTNSDTNITVDSILSINAATYDAGASALYAVASLGTCNINNTYALGNYFAAGTGQTDDFPGCDSNNSVFAHSIQDTEGSWGGGNKLLVPGARVTNFVVRDTLTKSSSISLIGDGTNYLKNGYIKRSATSIQMRVPQYGIATVENVGFFSIGDFRDSGATGWPLGWNASLPLTGDCTAIPTMCNPDAIWKNLTFAQEPGVELANQGYIYIIGVVETRGTFENIAFAGITGGQNNFVDTSNFGIKISDPWTGGFEDATGNWCSFANRRTVNTDEYREIDPTAEGPDLVAAIIANGGTYTRNIDPQWYDQGRNQFWPVPGSPWSLAGCGMKKGTGVRIRMLGHKVLDLSPDFQGEIGSGGGSGGAFDQH